MKKPSPKKYLTSFDVSIIDCKNCGAGKHYQVCRTCDKELACSGWALDGNPTCCECYEKAEKPSV